MVWDEILRAREVWLGKRAGEVAWPESGIAIEGDFAGIQQYVLKPVPGAKGAAKRLRGRSLQVSALTELIAKKTCETFRDSKRVYSAGGRFLIFAAASAGWRDQLTDLQKDLDHWIGQQFRGEVAFHLAGAEFSDGQIPREALGAESKRRKNRSLEQFLQSADGWVESRFLRKPEASDEKKAFVCPACLTTAAGGVPQPDENNQRICDECERDRRLGEKLAGAGKALIAEADDGEIRFLDQKSFTIADKGTSANVIYHMPRDNDGEAMDLEEIAKKSVGPRKFLAYLRIDADGMGAAFYKLKNDAERVGGLSRLLQLFFCDHVQELIKKEERYRWLYPVYGGGDDLFVIGPWNLALDFAEELAAEFKKACGEGQLTFSAGVALAKPKQHILTKSDEAAIALNERAKERDGKAAIHVFGETFSWKEFPGVLRSAKKMTGWYEGDLISSQFLQLLLALHADWREAKDEKDEAKQVRHRPILHYQMERNLKKPEQAPVKDWLAKTLARQTADPEASWRAIGFGARYAMLAARKKNGKEEEA
jgi:CRISPR-associated protein Csm1